MSRLSRLWLGLVMALMLGAAHAHEMTLAEMQVRETAPGQFLWLWTATNELAPGKDLQPMWPEGCSADQNTLRCGPGGLHGSLAMTGIGKAYSAALVKIAWLDGQTRVYTLTPSQPSVQLYGAADDPRGMAAIGSAYLVLGIEHILSGIDHLLFVAGLLFLVGFRRQLFWTITAFTLAHSMTLVSAALGWLTLRSPPVEACIALSIVLVAAESLHRRPTLARRWPALLAFGFGLVHGLGFAGALTAIGLPQQHLATALLGFNLGVEMGQLMAVGSAALVVYTLRRAREDWARSARVPTLYAIGSLAAYWSLTRVIAIGS
ncbi:MAG: HupE/UreJ family protein [Rubrivivax sp.]